MSSSEFHEKFKSKNLRDFRLGTVASSDHETPLTHFASLMDTCHLKNAELEAKHQKYKGRVVLRGDIVKDDSGSYAVFSEQGSSASQMTAAKTMDIISRLPGCDGQAADAVSAYTQVKMEDDHKLLKNPKSECPDIWIRLPRHKWPISWSTMEDPVVHFVPTVYTVSFKKGNAKLREKHIWAIGKTKLDNERRLRGMYNIDPVSAPGCNPVAV